MTDHIQIGLIETMVKWTKATMTQEWAQGQMPRMFRDLRRCGIDASIGIKHHTDGVYVDVDDDGNGWHGLDIIFSNQEDCTLYKLIGEHPRAFFITLTVRESWENSIYA